MKKRMIAAALAAMSLTMLCTGCGSKSKEEEKPDFKAAVEEVRTAYNEKKNADRKANADSDTQAESESEAQTRS